MANGPDVSTRSSLASELWEASDEDARARIGAVRRALGDEASGARVALWLPVDRLVDAFAAVLAAGATALVVPARHRHAALVHHLVDAEARWLVCTRDAREDAARAAQAAPSAPRVIIVDDLAPHPTCAPAPRGIHDAALCSYAEDVPDRPRGAIHSHAALDHALTALRSALGLGVPDTVTVDLAISEGALLVALAARLAGARAVLRSVPIDADAIEPIAADVGPTVAVMRARMLARQGLSLVRDHASLRALIGVGGTVATSTARSCVSAAAARGRALEVASALSVRELPLWLSLSLEARSGAPRLREGPLAHTRVVLDDDARLRVRGPAIPTTFLAADATRAGIDAEGWMLTRERGVHAADGSIRSAPPPLEATAMDALDRALPPLAPGSPWLERTRTRTLDYPIGCGRGASIALEAGLKPMLRELLPVAAIDEARERFERAGWLTEASPLVFGPTRDGWLGRPESREDTVREPREERRPLYVGRDRGALREAIAAELARTTDGARALGGLLGYPPCCVEAFVGRTDRRAAGLWAAAAARSERFLPRLNVLDHAILSYVAFFPCRFDCPDAAARADALAALLARRHPALVSRIDAALARPRLVLAPEIQLALDPGPDAATHHARPGSLDVLVHARSIAAACVERDPRVPIDARESEITARALAWLGDARTVAIERGVLLLDGRPRPLPLQAPLPLLLPFGISHPSPQT
jgi:hypothetical protein